MKNSKNFFKITFFSLLLYLSIFAYIYNDKENRSKQIFAHEIENLKIHYQLTQNNFENLADSTVGMINNDDEIIAILTKFLDASDEEAKQLRIQLEKKLKTYYIALHDLGVLQMHFLDPHNITTFRMHKPSKYGDDLTDFKYSFRQTNLTRKPMSGLEKGRTSPSYRNVRPLYGKNQKYLGIVDIAFAPEVIQKNLSNVSKIHSHFLLKKSLFKERKWNRNDLKDDYIISRENEDYLEFKYHHTLKDDSNIIEFLQSEKKNIYNNMKNSQSFTLLNNHNNQTMIITFLPLYNMLHEPIAYLVSYTNNDVLYKMYVDFYIINLIVILVVFLFAFIFYKTKAYNKELRAEKIKYYTLSQYDVLTELPNRYLFFDRIRQSKNKANRHNEKFALLFIDLDNFKHINDSYGHHKGDKVLQYVATLLNTLKRKEDTLARIGGDEFILIMEELHDEKDAMLVANNIITQLKKRITIEDLTYYIGSSIGISIYPDDSEDINDLIKFADTAMYKAKNIGKNNAQFYSKNMSDEIMDKITLEGELRDAIKNNEFVPYYQPQIDAATNTLVGMEVLVRWEHPTKGLVAPYKFIPLAEETGLIIPLDQLVMRQAMTQFAKWYANGFNPGKLSLNLAMKQLEQNDFIEILHKLIDETHCKNSWLELEVTETQLMSNIDQSISKLNQIKQMGIELAVDDFGTGYSSLSYLKKLPINKLKIDQSFVQDLPDDEEDASIVKAIIALAQSLTLKIIAEGVETQSQKDFMLENGCDLIQGYFYSKPVPADEMQKKFLNHQ